MELRRFFSLFVSAVLPVLGLAAVLACLPAPGEAAGAAAAVIAAGDAAVIDGQDPPAATAPAGVRSADDDVSDKQVVAAMKVAAPAVSPPPETPPPSRDAALTLRLLQADTVVTLSMSEYLLGVVAAEMPASFPLEALKAQAVAARTDTLYRMLTAHPHREADCCADAACCKAYRDKASLQAAWGERYDETLRSIQQAVTETDGQILRYDGQPIFAAFHAASPGSTACSEEVWITALPYLRSVESSESEARVPQFYSAVTMTYAELREQLLAACPAWVPGDEPAAWLHEAVYSESGRLQQVSLGTETLRGTALRAALGLRSAAVTWTCGEDGIRFETAGYGHGVGLSQYGAEAMALDGADYAEILAHYYTGAELGTID